LLQVNDLQSGFWGCGRPTTGWKATLWRIGHTDGA
jgi:hypothetical protein